MAGGTILRSSTLR